MQAAVGLGSGLVALAIYLLTLQQSLPPGDSGDLITAAAALGIAHPPGYPLFAIIGHLFTLLPLGNPAIRVNLMSAVLDAIAVAIVAVTAFRIVFEASPRARDHTLTAAVAATAGGIFLAFSTEFWAYSLVAEVFALNNFFAAVLIFLAYSWYRNPNRRAILWAFFLASGLAVCNQQTIVLIGPGLAVLLLFGIRRRSIEDRDWLGAVSREFAAGVGFLVVGLLPYAYLPIAAAADPPAMWGDPSTLDRFVAVVTRADYGSFALVAGGQHGQVTENLRAFTESLLGAFGFAGLILAAAGTWWFVRRAAVVGLSIVLCFAVSGPLFLAYANPPISGLLAGIFARFYILPSVPFAIIVAGGVAQTIEWLLRVPWPGASLRRVSRPRVAISAAIAVVLGLLLTGTVAARYASIDQSRNNMTIDFVKDLLAPLDERAILLTEGDTAVLGTWYAQNVEGVRPDVTVIAVPLLHYQWYIDQMRRQHPEISIPFEAADVIGAPVTERILNANFDRHPVYYVGVIPENYPTGYGELRTGFARKFVKGADGGDPFAYVRSHLDSLARFRFPDRLYPPTTWENWEAEYYGGAAFDLANAYETVDPGQAEQWYRAAIRYAPRIPGAYKNLAILLGTKGGSSSEIADLLETYLRLSPNDPEAATIRESIQQLRAGAP